MRRIKKSSEKKELQVTMEPEIDIDEQNGGRKREKDPLDISDHEDDAEETEEAAGDASATDAAEKPAKKGRGRPKKNGVGSEKVKKATGEKRGRKRKAAVYVDEDEGGDDADDGGEEAEYEVEDIVDHRTQNRKTLYRIRWKGYGARADTWEEESTLNCEKIMARYLKRSNSKPRPKTKAAKKVMPAAASSKPGKKRGRKPKSEAKEKTKNGAPAKKRGRPSKSDAEWEVEDVVSHRISKKGELEFFIKWKGYKSSENTWEPESNVTNCDKIVEKFKKAHNID